jgi:hypothetical protein
MNEAYLPCRRMCSYDDALEMRWRRGVAIRCAFTDDGAVDASGTAGSAQAQPAPKGFRYFYGTVVTVAVLDPHWPGSTWESVKVRQLADDEPLFLKCFANALSEHDTLPGLID